MRNRSAPPPNLNREENEENSLDSIVFCNLLIMMILLMNVKENFT